MSLVPIEDYMAVAGEAITMLELDADQIENILDNIPPPPEPASEPEVTKAKLAVLKNIVYATASFEDNVARAGGWVKIGQACDLWPSQAEKYALMMRALKNVYDAAKEG